MLPQNALRDDTMFHSFYTCLSSKLYINYSHLINLLSKKDFKFRVCPKIFANVIMQMIGSTKTSRNSLLI